MAVQVFSAGLDLSELVLSRGNTQNNNTRESVRTYMTGFQELVAAVAGSKVPTATVVQGACPAGGTVLAMCTDYKVASSLQPGKFSMGLNETRVGLSPPLWLHTLARLNLKSSRTADTMIQLGYLCSTPEEALSHGFLDTVLPDGSPDQVEADAIHRIELLNQIPWEARVAAKLGARVKLLHRLQASTDDIVDCIVGEEFQTVTGNLLASMKKK
ncbi:dodecenoyl-CoA isomerase [Entophlyctis sp. JEL0112]|nr:dodecenoyl-CoA isomerase [Entophlyctis sp. JEL0112]